ncbi:MAG: imidazole glycerol phosphate synthase subunit HisH [Alphaproteobacteria bacterium]
MKTVIIDYGSGNLHSAAKAFERAADPGMQISVTSDARAVAAADRVVLPGVGAYADCRSGLLAVDGMMDALQHAVTEKGRPFFGICVGMQLMASLGEEHGETPGFGWVPGRVTAIRPADPSLKVPHMGWNTLATKQDHAVMDGIDVGAYFYFVHSYHLMPDDGSHLLGTVDYGQPLTAAVGHGTMFGTQFHPEKSQASGLKLISNFLKWSP